MRQFLIFTLIFCSSILQAKQISFYSFDGPFIVYKAHKPQTKKRVIPFNQQLLEYFLSEEEYEEQEDDESLEEAANCLINMTIEEILDEHQKEFSDLIQILIQSNHQSAFKTLKKIIGPTLEKLAFKLLTNNYIDNQDIDFYNQRIKNIIECLKEYDEEDSVILKQQLTTDQTSR